MEISRWMMVGALSLFLAEGFALSVFPAQCRAFLLEADPRMLQWAGLLETVVAMGLMAGILLG